MGVSDKTRKILWIQAGGFCAICRKQVITPGTESDDPSVFGEEAHIVARSEGGPRAGGLAEDLINHHSNLILLCSKDHKRVDDQPNHFTVERLRRIKSEHEARVRSMEGTEKDRLRLVPDPEFPQPKVLKLITRGNPLWNMIKESLAFEYGLPDDLRDDEEDLIIEFLDLIRDYLDIARELDSVRENRDAEKGIQQYISRLAERDFLVGAYVRHFLLTGGNVEMPTPWPMLRVEVQPAALAEVADKDGTPYFPRES
ncbi:HNH endonuclease signature motif containing protein [Streptomyces sp. H34-S4]|uniref:HNH endonuclease signature motif containing protein n=1 Tax=Streptomyces sp. H34-S4 TaxID=2996463 RepID=UPI00226DD421|nr:HNH endonuclease signature motif containing protein [Streptomyces sp. H34-S4]MCY0933186.1 HNH endonuclease signature motif containing protein [Streptomyces sp. H34-S4]